MRSLLVKRGTPEPKPVFIGGIGSPYTSQVVQDICQRNGIDPSFMQPLHELLDFAYFLYSIRTSARFSRLSNKQIKARLKKLERQSAKLAKEIEAMPAQVFRYCEQSCRELSEEQRIDPGIKRMEHITQAFKALDLVFKGAAKRVMPDQAGKLPDEALYVWVKALSEFWKNSLKRPYTLDVHQQLPVTDAGRFLADCLKPLNPHALPRLSGQMRRFKEEQSNLL
jgi:hypothetical protein